MRISEMNDNDTSGNSLSGLGAAEPSLKRGSGGPAVQAMQKVLISFGYPLKADGAFGPASEAAVKAVQAKLKLSVTGVWDDATRNAVNGVTQSGVIDAQASDKQAIAVASSQNVTVSPIDRIDFPLCVQS